MAAPPKTSLFAIRQVTELTGVTEFLLRIWENRYEAFRPRRTPTGRRLYTGEDVLRAKALLDLTQRGHRIGGIARLPLSSLQKLLDSTPVQEPIPADEDVQETLRLADQFRWDECRALFVAKRKGSAGLIFLRQFVIPLLREIGIRVEAQTLCVAKEHILSALIKEFVSAVPPSRGPARGKARMVFATPEGDFHDIGILIASRIAALKGIRTLFLGANMPKRELSETCLRFEASHLLLASTATRKQGAKEDLLEVVSFLDRNLPRETAFWLAGIGAESCPLSLKRELLLLPSMQEFERKASGL